MIIAKKAELPRLLFDAPLLLARAPAYLKEREKKITLLFGGGISFS